METKRNLKYFTASGVSTAIIVGAALIVLGVILCIVPQTRQFGILIIMAGLCIVVFASGSKAKESDIDYQIDENIKEIYETTMKKYEVYEKNFIRIASPALLKGFDYNTKNNFQFKRGTDAKNRTNYYTAVQFFYTNEKLYVYGKHFSMTDDLVNEEIKGIYNYTELGAAEVVEDVYETEKGRKFEFYNFKLTDKNGKQILYFTVTYGADVDKAVEQMNHVIAVKKKAAADKASMK